jgi:hypothetical protein
MNECVASNKDLMKYSFTTWYNKTGLKQNMQKLGYTFKAQLVEFPVI